MPLGVAGATALGAALSFIGGGISNALNYNVSKENLMYQKMANQQNIDFLRETNAQNIAFQKEENVITRMREDNAVQRAAADMTAAGLSKTLAAGNPASAQSLQAPSASAPQIKALNNQFKYESALQKMNIASLIQDMAEKQKELDMKEQYNNAQIDNIKADTYLKTLNGQTFMESFRNEQAIKMSQEFSFRMQAQESQARTEIYKIEGQYKAKEIESAINKQVSEIQRNSAETQFTFNQSRKLAQDISESVARTEKLGYETQMLVKDLALAQINLESNLWDLDYAKRYNLPVGALLNGNIGSWFNAWHSAAGADGKGGSGVNFGVPTSTSSGIVVPYGSYSSGMEVPKYVLDLVL